MSDRMNRDFRMPEKGDFKLPVDGDFKGDGRSGRLAKHKAVYKRMEDEFRKELMYDARQACKAQVAAFGECAKEQSLMVVFKCRDQNAKSKSYFFAKLPPFSPLPFLLM